MLQRVLAVILFSVVFTSTAAQAAVFKCVTAEGVAKFSNRPCPAQVLSGDSEAHQLYRDLQKELVKGSAIISSAQGGTAQVLSCQKKQKAYVDNLSTFEPRVKVQAARFNGFQSSYALLQQCGTCQSRARRHCTGAAKALNQVKSDIVNSQVKIERPAWARRYD